MYILVFEINNVRVYTAEQLLITIRIFFYSREYTVLLHHLVLIVSQGVMSWFPQGKLLEDRLIPWAGDLECVEWGGGDLFMDLRPVHTSPIVFILLY